MSEGTDLSQEKRYNKGMLRPVGIVAFIVVVTLLLASFYWLAPWLIKEGIERTGTKINGAKVELDSVDISLSPAGLYLHKLQVADADQPMENVFEFAQAYAELDLFELWSGKVIIEDLKLDALRFGTPRSRSGAIEKSELESDEPDAESSMEKASSTIADSASKQLERLSQNLPDADDLLSRHPLKTTQLAEALDKSFNDQKTQWQALSNDLPDKQRLSHYEQELKELTSGDIGSLEAFQARKQKFDAIKKEIEQDKVRLSQAKSQLKDSQNLVQQGLKDLKAAPKEDLASLKRTYSLDASGGLNLTGLLFGDEFKAYAQSALYWYERIAPIMATDGVTEGGEAESGSAQTPRGTGRFIHFGSGGAQPDFLVRNASAMAILSQGEVELNGRGLTHQQHLTGEPSVVTANAENLNDTELFNLRLVLDHRTEESVDEMTLDIKGQKLDDMALSKSDSLPISMNGAKLDVASKITLENLSLTGGVQGKFVDTALDVFL